MVDTVDFRTGRLDSAPSLTGGPASPLTSLGLGFLLCEMEGNCEIDLEWDKIVSSALNPAAKPVWSAWLLRGGKLWPPLGSFGERIP